MPVSTFGAVIRDDGSRDPGDAEAASAGSGKGSRTAPQRAEAPTHYIVTVISGAVTL